MQITRVSSGVNFGRSLKTDEIEEFKKTLKESKKVTGQTGKSALIIPLTTLPVSPEKDTGIGHITSKDGLDFIDYMKTYLDFNVVKDLPSGQIKHYKNFFCNYEASALALGDQNINPELLTQPEYGAILTKEEFQTIVKSNNKANKNVLINCENTMQSGSPQDNALKKAYDRFKKLDANSELKQKYSKFLSENESWLNFPRKEEPDQEFFKFKQFLADEHLALGKKLLNERGIKLCGDCPINFTDDEVQAFPKAFKKDHYTGLPSWKIPSLDYDTILDESSDAYKLLKTKVQLMAKRYDMIRFDVGWNYITPIMTPKGEEKILDKNKKHLGSSLVDNIDRWVKEVKGEDFDLKNLVYEVEANPSDFAIFKPGGNELIDPLKDRVKVYSNIYMSEDWGSNDAFIKRSWHPDTFSIGTGNHDSQPLRQIAEGRSDFSNGEHKTQSIKPLSRILNINEADLADPSKYSKAKFAEIMSAKNIHYFFMDVFGREERYNLHSCETEVDRKINFRRRVPSDYKLAYQKALSEGFGLNIMDAFEKVFKAKGFDKSHQDLYARIVKFRDILAEKDPALIASEDIEENFVKIRPLEEIEGKIKEVKPRKWLWFTGIFTALGGAYAIYKKHEEKVDNPQKVYA